MRAQLARTSAHSRPSCELRVKVGGHLVAAQPGSSSADDKHHMEARYTQQSEAAGNGHEPTVCDNGAPPMKNTCNGALTLFMTATL